MFDNSFEEHGKNRVQGVGCGVATISRLLEIIELFCKRAL